VLAARQENQESDEDDLGPEHWRRDGDVPPADRDKGEDLTDEKRGARQDRVGDVGRRERFAPVQQPGLEKDGPDQVHDEQHPPRMAAIHGSFEGHRRQGVAHG